MSIVEEKEMSLKMATILGIVMNAVLAVGSALGAVFYGRDVVKGIKMRKL